jgi:hypothetical protein
MIYIVGCIDQCSLLAVICPSFVCALTAASMSRMTSLNETLLVNFVSNLGFALSFICNRPHHIQIVVRQST